MIGPNEKSEARRKTLFKEVREMIFRATGKN